MSPAASPSDELLGRLLGGRYRIERELARGGMATVYRAADERLQRPVAVKVLSATYAAQPAYVERFLAEARTAASFSHPNLAHVYDSGSDGAEHFLVLELLERHRSLRGELRDRGRLPPLEAAGVALDVLAGLEPLHDHGMVHCDVKPGNVMIGPEGTKLIDFGIARPLDGPITEATSVGSLHAMSPEQLHGAELGPPSDLFAVGVLLYECLTGRVPFPGATPEEVAAGHERGPQEPPSRLAATVHPRLDDVVFQALRADPARRFASAAAMATALRSAAAAQRAADEVAGQPADDDTTSVHVVPAAPVPSARRAAAGRPPRRGAWAAAVAAAVLVPALVLGIVLLGAPGDDGRGTASASPTPSSAASAGASTLAPGMVRVPNTIGMTEAEGQAAAQRAGLAWRLEWRVAPGQDPGIYEQDPAPGTVVREGSPFLMLAYRSR